MLLTIAAEHIYEGNWIREFLDYANEKLTGSSNGTCHDSILNLWTSSNPPYVMPPGTPESERKDNYILALAQQLGNKYTPERMALVHGRINLLKYGVSATLGLQIATTTDSVP